MIGGDLGKMLAVINIGNVFTTGPMQAAFVINKLVQPNSVIVSHANEVATRAAAMIGGTKTEQSIKATESACPCAVERPHALALSTVGVSACRATVQRARC